MDHNQFATEPHSPRWEIPQSFRAATEVAIVRSSDPLLSLQEEVPDTRIAILNKVTCQLEKLCSDNAMAQSLLDLLEVWSTVTRHGNPELQPNLLAWFQCSKALEHAVRNQRNDIVELLLSHGLVPKEDAISAALKIALDSHDTSTLALLVRGGWDINQVCFLIRPSIMSVVVQDEFLVKWCLSAGADPNRATPSNTTVLHLAASIGTLESVKTLISAGAEFKRPCYSDDIIAHAVQSHDEHNDRLPIIELLLDHGADIDAYYEQNRNPEYPSGMEMIIGKQTALHFAVGRGDRQMVEMLMKRGADPGKLMWNYSTAYDVLKGVVERAYWEKNIKWIDAIEYARFLGFGDIKELLRTSSRL